MWYTEFTFIYLIYRSMKILSRATFLGAMALALVAGPALATDTVPVNNTTTKTGLTAEQRTCVATAIGKRETALIGAVDAYNVTWKAALVARQDALTKAWALETKKERTAAQKSAASVFKKAKQGARATLTSARDSAWKTYKSERKTCSTKAMSEDMVSHSIDN